MSNKTRKSAKSTAAQERPTDPVEIAPGIEVQRPSGESVAESMGSVNVATEPAPVVTFQTPEPAAKTGEGRRRKSLVESPVARVWYNCMIAVEAARAAGKPLPGRKALHEINMADGIAYYTSRTQVQAYLKASRNGTQQPKKLPKGVTIN